MARIFQKLLPRIAVLLVAVLGVELVSFCGVYFLKKRLVFYNPPLLSTYAEYIENRDPILGWPSKKVLREKYDASGSRPIPAFPTFGNSCISLYGDSFTWSDSVDDQAAWSNQLSLLRQCRVSNYGVSGYGTDQAFMRFEQNEDDEAPIVLLNHFTGDIRRNVTQFRNLTSDDDHFLLKPRFILQDGKLVRIPLLHPTFEEARQIAEHPEHLPYEYFVPGGRTGITKAGFPYTLSMISAFGNEHLRAKLSGHAVWEAYYDPDHSSDALRLTVMIMENFATLGKQRGKRPIVTVIPNAHDIHAYEQSGKWSYRYLLDELKKSGIEFLDFGPGILEKTRGIDICDVMEKATCYGHYNEKGYKILAGIVDDYLKVILKQ